MKIIFKISIILLAVMILTINVTSSYGTEANALNSHLETSENLMKDTSGAKNSVSNLINNGLKISFVLYAVSSLIVLFEIITKRSNKIVESIIFVLSILVCLIGRVYIILLIPVILLTRSISENKKLKVVLDILLVVSLVIVAYTFWIGIHPELMAFGPAK